jgi:hypothetical protein
VHAALHLPARLRGTARSPAPLVVLPAVFARASLLRHRGIDAASVRQEPSVDAGSPIDQLAAVL